MIVDADKTGAKVTASHDPRITRIGSLLRKTKIDELPHKLRMYEQYVRDHNLYIDIKIILATLLKMGRINIRENLIRIK